jgi:DNA repair photolyase
MSKEQDYSPTEVLVEISGRSNSRSVGSLAIGATGPRTDLDEMIRSTASWNVTGEVAVGEVGPGCSLDCAYCNQVSFDVSDTGEQLAGYIEVNDAGTSLNTRIMVGRKIEREITPEKVVEELQQSAVYDENGWLLLENYNDPGMNWKQTLHLIELLLDSGHEGPMTFITKSGLPEVYAQQMGELRERGAKLIGIVSYPGLPEELEPAPKKARLQTMERLKKNDIPLIVSLRPLISGINFNQETISKIVEETDSFADFYIAGGLFVFDDWTPEVFASRGYPLPEEYLTDGYQVAKVAPENLHEQVADMVRAADGQTMVMPHTSCAIAGLVTEYYDIDTPDRLAHWVDHKQPGTRFDTHCSDCPQEQQEVCKGVLDQDPELTLSLGRNVLRRLGYQQEDIQFSEIFDGHLLVVGGTPLNFSELAFIRQATGMYVNNLPTVGGLLYRADQAFREEFEVDLEDVLTGVVYANEEWHMFLETGVDAKNNVNVEKHIRTRARARVKVHTLSDYDEDGMRKLLVGLGIDYAESDSISRLIHERVQQPELRDNYRDVVRSTIAELRSYSPR